MKDRVILFACLLAFLLGLAKAHSPSVNVPADDQAAAPQSASIAGE